MPCRTTRLHGRFTRSATVRLRRLRHRRVAHVCLQENTTPVFAVDRITPRWRHRIHAVTRVERC